MSTGEVCFLSPPEILRFCQTSRHFDMSRTACYQRKCCPVVTASPENQITYLLVSSGALKDIFQKYEKGTQMRGKEKENVTFPSCYTVFGIIKTF